MPDSGYRFPSRLSCRLTVLVEMFIEGLSIVVVVGWDVHHYLKRIGRQREIYPHLNPNPHKNSQEEQQNFSFNLLEFFAELDIWSMLGHSLSLLGLFVALLLLITGVRVLIGPCQLTPQVTERRKMKSGIKVCTLWCTLEFLRFILLLLGVSTRLMVLSLLAFDELTNFEIAKQASALIPLVSSLTGMCTTAKFRGELEAHYGTLLPQLPPLQLPETSYMG